MNKTQLLQTLVACLEEERDALLKSAERTRQAATHEEARPENDKDTRALEASYLARGQAKRVEESNETITRLRFLSLKTFTAEEPIDMTALVELEAEDETFHVFLLPVGGGSRVEFEGHTVRVVTPAAPLGRALLNRETGDDFELQVARQKKQYVVVSVV